MLNLTLYLDALDKTLRWIESNQLIEVIANYCDPESMQCYGKPLRGWASPHLAPETGPQAWSTAQTITCISRMRKIVRDLMHDDVLMEFGGLPLSGEPKMASWDRLLDTDLGNPCSVDKCRTLKDVIEERIITPFSGEVTNPSYGAVYSAILFGPPGTAKVGDMPRH